MYNFFNNHLLSQRLQAKAEAAALAGQLDGDSNSACDWQGDPPEPELDDLAHPPPEKKEQPSRSADVCDWRGDEPEQHEDDLGQICPSDSRDQKSTRRDKAVEEANAIEMPIPRAPNTGIPQIIFPLQEHDSVDQKHDPKAPSDRPVQDGKQSESGKKSRKKKPRAGVTTSPGQIDRGTDNGSPTEDKTHSPWVDSLEHMSTAVMDRVNMGVKQTLDAATSILTPSTNKKPASPEPSRKPSGLAPPSVAYHPPELFHIPKATNHDAQGDNKKQGREKARLEKKAQREAKRKARQAKKNERREKRRETKERRRKEKQSKRAAKKGGELPAHLRQGLRDAPDSKILHHHGCNNEGQPGDLGQHGLDRNRDSPTATDGGQMVSIPYRNSESLTMPMPSEVDWWAQALSSEMPSPSPYRSSSTPFAVPLLPRSKTTVYEPKRVKYSIPNRFDSGSAAYHFYLPLPHCHSFCCPTGHASGLDNCHTPSFPRSAPAVSPGYCYDQEALVPMAGWAETLASDTPRPMQDGIFHPRSRSGSI